MFETFYIWFIINLLNELFLIIIFEKYSCDNMEFNFD